MASMFHFNCNIKTYYKLYFSYIIGSLSQCMQITNVLDVDYIKIRINNPMENMEVMIT